MSGFNNAWGLASGTSTVYAIQVYAGFPGLTAITEGGIFTLGGRTAKVTP